jgi:hypothetical protein
MTMTSGFVPTVSGRATLPVVCRFDCRYEAPDEIHRLDDGIGIRRERIESGCPCGPAAKWAGFGGPVGFRVVNLLSLATTSTRHVGSDPNVERDDPGLWTDGFALLNQPGQRDIQSESFYDHHSNVEAYPKWQACMRQK